MYGFGVEKDYVIIDMGTASHVLYFQDPGITA